MALVCLDPTDFVQRLRPDRDRAPLLRVEGLERVAVRLVEEAVVRSPRRDTTRRTQDTFGVQEDKSRTALTDRSAPSSLSPRSRWRREEVSVGMSRTVRLRIASSASERRRESGRRAALFAPPRAIQPPDHDVWPDGDVARFEHGARRTLDFFRAHQQDYVNPSAGFPQCALREPAVLKQKVSA